MGDYQKLSEIPFDPVRRRSSALYKNHHVYEVMMRGAPQDVIGCCINLCPIEQGATTQWLEQEGNKGNRVIAIARKKYPVTDAHAAASLQEHSMKLVGLISFADPLKKTASAALEKAKQLGIMVKILNKSGDAPEVCAAIGRMVGLVQHPDQLVTGQQLSEQSHDEKKKLVERGTVFARVTPMQKYEIIELLQEHYNRPGPPWQAGLARQEGADAGRGLGPSAGRRRLGRGPVQSRPVGGPGEGRLARL